MKTQKEKDLEHKNYNNSIAHLNMSDEKLLKILNYLRDHISDTIGRIKDDINRDIPRRKDKDYHIESYFINDTSAIDDVSPEEINKVTELLYHEYGWRF